MRGTSPLGIAATLATLSVGCQAGAPPTVPTPAPTTAPVTTPPSTPPSTPPPSTTPSTTPPSTTPPPATAPPASDTVAYRGAFSGAAGHSVASLTVAGEARSVVVYAPTTRGAHPPLLLVFHGTNGDGEVMLTESGARELADREGVVVVAPTARWFGDEGADYDHPQGNGTYWETRTTDPNTNHDLMLVRAAIVEARRAYDVDPDRVYAMGHSNGGFMAVLVSVALRDKVAAFAENSSGLVSCRARPECMFQGQGSTCAAFASQSGWCACAGPDHPVTIPANARPGYLSHGAQDPMVSVFYTCALAARLQAAGAASQTYLWDGGHYLGATFATRAWAFMSRYRRQ